jgi:hypothetical protein
LCTIEEVAGYTPTAVEESAEWTAVGTTKEENWASYCKALSGKTPFSALYGTYTVALQELKALLKVGTTSPQTAKTPTQEEGFQEVRRRKRHSSNEAARTSKKILVTAAPAAVNTTPKTVPTRNFFAPLRTSSMDTEASDTEESPQGDATPGKTGRPPPIVITATVNLLQLQKLIKSVVKENFEFQNSRNGTRVITKTLGDFAAEKSYLRVETHNLHYFTFYPKSLKPIKAIIRHLPLNTPEQDISDGLMDLGFDIISVKKISTTRRSPPEGTLSKNIPLFLNTLPRTAKCQEIFRLTALCHIELRAEAYRAQNGLT